MELALLTLAVPRAGPILRPLAAASDGRGEMPEHAAARNAIARLLATGFLDCLARRKIDG